MKKLSPVLVALLIFVPSVSFAAALTTQQASSLIAVVQSSPGTPASAFTNLITAFSNITIAQADSLIGVVQAATGVPASAFVNLLTSFTVDTVAVQPTTQTVQTDQSSSITQPASTCGTQADVPMLSLTPEMATAPQVGKYTYLDVSAIGSCVADGQAMASWTTPNANDDSALHLLSDITGGNGGKWAIGFMPLVAGPQTITVHVDGASASLTLQTGVQNAMPNPPPSLDASLSSSPASLFSTSNAQLASYNIGTNSGSGSILSLSVCATTGSGMGVRNGRIFLDGIMVSKNLTINECRMGSTSFALAVAGPLSLGTFAIYGDPDASSTQITLTGATAMGQDGQVATTTFNLPDNTLTW